MADPTDLDNQKPESYPFLRIAKEYDEPYEKVLAHADYYTHKVGERQYEAMLPIDNDIHDAVSAFLLMQLGHMDWLTGKPVRKVSSAARGNTYAMKGGGRFKSFARQLYDAHGDREFLVAWEECDRATHAYWEDIANHAEAIRAERRKAKGIRLRDCPCCHAPFTADPDKESAVNLMSYTDVIHDVVTGYEVTCTGCGLTISDEYQDEVVRLWNGEPKKDDDDE